MIKLNHWFIKLLQIHQSIPYHKSYSIFWFHIITNTSLLPHSYPCYNLLVSSTINKSFYITLSNKLIITICILISTKNQFPFNLCSQNEQLTTTSFIPNNSIIVSIIYIHVISITLIMNIAYYGHTTTIKNKTHIIMIHSIIFIYIK